MKVLVTGGTGFLGEQVVRELVETNVDVVSLSRSQSPVLRSLGVTQLEGSVLNENETTEAMAGCSYVIHAAGLVSRDPDDVTQMMRLHVDGTRTVLKAAAKAGIKRVVLASSSGVVAVSEEQTIHDETEGYATHIAVRWPYYASKIYQEKLFFGLAKELGLEAVAVNPSLLLGPGDRRLSSTRDVLRFMQGRLPVVPEGGVNFVDVRDAAKATVAALTKAKDGHRYLLGGPNWTFAEFLGRLSRVARVTRPRVRLSRSLSKFGAVAIEKLYRSRGAEPPVDEESVDMADHYWWVDSSKAEKELGFESRDPGVTLSDTVKYLRQDLSRSF